MAKGKLSFSYNYFLLLLVSLSIAEVDAKPAAIFIFGDSTFDVGTNNFLNGTTALANFPYNGIDFPDSIPTGRFSNGYNLADRLAMLFGYERSPLPYLYLVNNMSIFREEILKGVNFASGGSGILDQTGKILWHGVVPLRDQIQQFALVRENITEMKGADETAKNLSNSLFIFSVGSNDILDTLRLGANITKEQLMATLRSAYYQHLKNLYNMGARKFGIIGAAPIGCCPFSRAMNKSLGGNGGCLKAPNEFARRFYFVVRSLLQRLTSEFPEMKYSLGNVYNMTSYILKNHRTYGFEEIKEACCGSGDYNGVGYCNKTENPNLCQNRKEYLFWDLYHPSEAATNLTALTLYYGGTDFVKPINFGQLAEIQL
ncbi:GDSL esterase/lipase At4g16230-like [Jatropha curcas]|uniref:GDSL esterase/lipase At4g16230-like n=1 Tax=Jatropha curcas TaxID=180498 RepID=UPI0005FAD6D7|nr:GDSL esterase/lipase At4g16230-like [Jatropha curcas]